MTQRIVVRYFDYLQSTAWSRMARVLRASIEQNCPSWDLDMQLLRAPTESSPRGVQGDVSNTCKLDSWADAVAAAKVGDRMLLLDADTMVRRSLDAVWNIEFDLAYTIRPKGSGLPFNGGVVFLRVTPFTKVFMKRWQAENRRMLEDPLHHQVWRPAFGGINQAALGMIFRTGGHGLKVHQLPCLEWNCEDTTWADFDPDLTRIVHYKSNLQRAIFGKPSTGPVNKALVEEWRSMEHEIERPREPELRTTQVTESDLLNREHPALPPPQVSARRRRRGKDEGHGASA